MLELAFDAALALLLLGIGAWSMLARNMMTAVIVFIVYGLLLSLVWVRIFAIDVSLTEAAGATSAVDTGSSGSKVNLALTGSCIFGSKGPAVIVENDDATFLLALAGLSNSQVFRALVEFQLAAAEPSGRGGVARRRRGRGAGDHRHGGPLQRLDGAGYRVDAHRNRDCSAPASIGPAVRAAERGATLVSPHSAHLDYDDLHRTGGRDHCPATISIVSNGEVSTPRHVAQGSSHTPGVTFMGRRPLGRERISPRRLYALFSRRPSGPVGMRCPL